MNVGVLALQGDFREHLSALGDCGVTGKLVKTAADISAIDALIIPGGESTTICKLSKAFDLFALISKRIQEGMPTYGSCAGMILVAKSSVLACWTCSSSARAKAATKHAAMQ